MLALAAFEDLELRSIDITHAYLNGTVEEEIYMKQPEGFEVGGPDHVCVKMRYLRDPLVTGDSRGLQRRI